MSYRSKYGITPIDQHYLSKDVDVFDISWDVDGNDELDKPKRYPVFLVVPDKTNPVHYHICLSQRGATQLRDWLDAYLKDVVE